MGTRRSDNRASWPSGDYKMADIQSLVDQLSELTVLQAADLAKALEERWGVSAAAAVAAPAARGAGAPAPGGGGGAGGGCGAPGPVAAPAAGGGGAAAPAGEEQTEFDVILVND